jgi:hypothetical protein
MRNDISPASNLKEYFNRTTDALSSQPIHVDYVTPLAKQLLRGDMNAEFDYELTREQWETLKALRLPAAERRILDRMAAKSLINLGLAATTGAHPIITPKGRHVLLRGSPRLWDVAA